MKTEAQLKELLNWERAEASLESTLGHLSNLELLAFAAELTYSTALLAPLACFAVMFEVHRREQL